MPYWGVHLIKLLATHGKRIKLNSLKLLIKSQLGYEKTLKSCKITPIY
ncbi:hypothetical protein MNBD_GAMMA02-117 [hydrothermal vent metagenome]|uniref:Uncharacterized protein n=1 Tax=hydrothermal vent metagenome TaxID=652676 RepID=A0A3B0W4I6_9ZZZZ